MENFEVPSPSNYSPIAPINQAQATYKPNAVYKFVIFNLKKIRNNFTHRM